jgi:uncharacterized protein YjbI with pentapeptide repeats
MFTSFCIILQARREITLLYEVYLKETHPRHDYKSCKVVLTSLEKRHLSGEIFRGLEINCLDFKGADLREARFESTSLCACDFSGADLRGAVFWDCDLRWARFDRAVFGDNSFKRSWLNGAEGITRSLFDYVRKSGGHFAYC